SASRPTPANLSAVKRRRPTPRTAFCNSRPFALRRLHQQPLSFFDAFGEIGHDSLPISFFATAISFCSFRIISSRCLTYASTAASGDRWTSSRRRSLRHWKASSRVVALYPPPLLTVARTEQILPP